MDVADLMLISCGWMYFITADPLKQNMLPLILHWAQAWCGITGDVPLIWGSPESLAALYFLAWPTSGSAEGWGSVEPRKSSVPLARTHADLCFYEAWVNTGPSDEVWGGMCLDTRSCASHKTLTDPCLWHGGRGTGDFLGPVLPCAFLLACMSTHASAWSTGLGMEAQGLTGPVMGFCGFLGSHSSMPWLMWAFHTCGDCAPKDSGVGLHKWRTLTFPVRGTPRFRKVGQVLPGLEVPDAGAPWEFLCRIRHLKLWEHLLSLVGEFRQPRAAHSLGTEQIHIPGNKAAIFLHHLFVASTTDMLQQRAWMSICLPQMQH